MKHLKHFKLNPWHYLFLSFLFLVLFGASLLLLPGIRMQNNLSVIDAVFTSTSAVCVTGLTVVDTPGFSLYGQIVLLILMQLGAIGIMTISTSLIQLIKGKLQLHHRLSFSQLQDNINLNRSRHVLTFIIKFTFLIELIGAILISLGFYLQGFTFKKAVYHGVFQSVSAFCNAGFSSFNSSLIGTHWLVKSTVMILIILGGLGYFVIYELYHKERTKRFSMYTRIVLYVTGFLILFGGISFFIIENDMNLLDSFFQSVTARTAGFNSVDITKMHLVSLFILIVLMFIGASPGSTGGGIKTTTFFLVSFSVFKVLRGETSINIWNRNISGITVMRAFALMVVYSFVAIIAGLLLLLVYDFDFLQIMFEVVSALGTVGLSLGLTAKFGVFGKAVLIFCMFLGRIGPATLAMITLRKQKKVKIMYPEGKIVLG